MGEFFPSVDDPYPFPTARPPPLVRRCSVEYAPYQKVARQKVKRDPKEGTIDKGAPSSQRSRA